jgi:hypothetical protein
MKSIRRFAFSACAIAALICAQSKQAAPQPPAQPVPFNHKTHVAAGLTCTGCHTIAPPGDLAGYPNVNFCMGCHSSIKKNSPSIQTLAAYAKDEKPVPWVKVYTLPPFVYFSHQVHYKKAGVQCAECHGPVAERDALGKERGLEMNDCMKCHDQRKAPNGCDVCHDSH